MKIVSRSFLQKMPFMNPKSFLSFLTLSLALLNACETDSPERKEPEDIPSESSVIFSSDSLVADPEGDAVSFRLTTSSPWTVQADQSWVMLSPESGTVADKRRIDVVVETNDTGADRVAEITVTSGDDRKTIVVVQGPREVIADFSTDVESLTLDASGQTKAVVVVKSQADFGLSYGVGWLNVTDENGGLITGKQKATKSFMVAVSAQANFDGADRSGDIIFSVDGKGEYRIPVKQTGDTFVEGSAGLPAIWLFNDTNVSDMRRTFMGPAYVQASKGSCATISVHRAAVNQQKEMLDYNVASDGGLEMRMLGEGDYFLYNIPVENLPAGTSVHITASYHSDNSANKYFVFEFYEAGQWKMTRSLKTSPEGVGYHYQSNGLGLSQAYTPNIDETVTLEEGIGKGTLKMRLRCVGDRKYDGGELVFSSNALTRMAAAKTHGTSPIVRLLDGPLPDRSVKVLFIGNSYTYYNWSSYMLKEIAWKEGLEVKVALSAHSGFTVERHMSHSVTRSFIEEGGYDYAIVQEYNDRTAVIGADLIDGELGADAAKYIADMTGVVAEIKKASPSAAVLVEMSWGTKTGTGSLIKTDWTDYATMQGYVTEGTKHAASEAGAGYTLLGKAWEKVRAERPELEMYHTDNHHPSYAGSYLKACVNYLTLSGRPFSPDPCDCLLDAETAAYLRSVAESVVLK